MRIHRVRMLNFRQHARTDLRLHDGVTAIVGPNGSGKTTILEAIAWALYGQSAVRGDRDGIRFMGAGARAPVEVELDFELGGHRYRVTRGMTTAAVYLDGAELPVANSISGVNDLLQRRLGMTRTEFFNTYFTGQKELAVMTTMGRTERAQFLSRVLGYERLRTAQELARERRREVGAQIAGLRQGMADANAIEQALREATERVAACVAHSNESGTRHARALAVVRALAPRWEAAQTARDAWQQRGAERGAAEGEIVALERDLARVAGELAGLTGMRDELEVLRVQLAPLGAYRVEIRQLADQLQRQGRRQALTESAEALSSEVVALRERADRLADAPSMEAEAAALLEQERRALEDVVTSLDRARTDWARDRQEAQTKLEELRRQYGEIKDQRERLEELGPDGPCPTCSRVLGGTYGSVLEQLREQLDTLHVDGQYYRNRTEQLATPPAQLDELEEQRRAATGNIAQLERRLARLQAAIQEIPGIRREIAAKDARREDLAREIAELAGVYDAERHAFLRAEVERLGSVEVRVARLEGEADRIPRLQAEHERVTNALGTARARLEALSGAGDTPPFSEAEFESLRTEVQDASEDARTAELAVVAAQGEVRAAQVALDAAEDARREHVRVADTLAALTGERALVDELDRAFSELRADLNDALRPEVSEVATSFLSLLTDGRYTEFELNDDYQVVLLEDGVVRPVISGGEEDLANLVLRLAISQMIADRSGQPFSLLVLDEIFGALDAVRRDNVITLLRGLHDRFEQVILITHVEAVRDGVDHVISVRYDEESGSSVVDAGDAAGVLEVEGRDAVLEPA